MSPFGIARVLPEDDRIIGIFIEESPKMLWDCNEL